MASLPFQFTPCIAVDTSGTSEPIISFSKDAYPSGASAPSLTVLGVVATVFQGAASPSYIAGTHGVWSWTSTQSGGTVNAGLQLVIGQIFRKPGTATMRVFCRIKTSTTARLSEVYIDVRSVDGSGSSTSGDELANMTGGSWYNYGSSAFSTPTGTEISVTINVKGTTSSGNIGASDFYVEYIYVTEV